MPPDVALSCPALAARKWLCGWSGLTIRLTFWKQSALEDPDEVWLRVILRIGELDPRSPDCCRLRKRVTLQAPRTSIRMATEELAGIVPHTPGLSKATSASGSRGQVLLAHLQFCLQPLEAKRLARLGLRLLIVLGGC